MPIFFVGIWRLWRICGFWNHFNTQQAFSAGGGKGAGGWEQGNWEINFIGLGGFSGMECILYIKRDLSKDIQYELMCAADSVFGRCSRHGRGMGVSYHDLWEDFGGEIR